MDVAPDRDRLAFRALTGHGPDPPAPAQSGAGTPHPSPSADTAFRPAAPRRGLPDGGPAALRGSGARARPPWIAWGVEGNAAHDRRVRSSAPPASILPPARHLSRHPARHHRPSTSTGQFDDVQVEKRADGGKLVLIVAVKERPRLEPLGVRWLWTTGRRSVGTVTLVRPPARPRRAGQGSRAAIDSSARRGILPRPGKGHGAATANGGVQVLFQVPEGHRVAVSQMATATSVHRQTGRKHMATHPEGFLWFQRGEYDELTGSRKTPVTACRISTGPRLCRLPGPG